MVWDSEVDLSIDNRSATIRSFLNAVHQGQRSDWLKKFYGQNAPYDRFTEKDDTDIIEDILSSHDSWTQYVFSCPNCRRLFIQRKSGIDEYDSYKKE